jgi:hypothetical protein
MIEDMPDDNDLPKHRPEAEEGNKQEREETETKRGEKRMRESLTRERLYTIF